jgi:hypothetical protein
MVMNCELVRIRKVSRDLFKGVWKYRGRLRTPHDSQYPSRNSNRVTSESKARSILLYTPFCSVEGCRQYLDCCSLGYHAV